MNSWRSLAVWQFCSRADDPLWKISNICSDYYKVGNFHQRRLSSVSLAFPARKLPSAILRNITQISVSLITAHPGRWLLLDGSGVVVFHFDPLALNESNFPISSETCIRLMNRSRRVVVSSHCTNRQVASKSNRESCVSTINFTCGHRKDVG